MKKERWQTISKNQYQILLREIKDSYKKIGCSLKIYNKPIIWRRRGDSPNFGERSGYYDIEKKRAMIVFFGNIGRARKLQIILHELRHAQHHQRGLYKDYYEGKWRRIFFEENFIPKQMPKLEVGLEAEIDCNKFAYYWLKKRGVEIPKDFSYNLETTAEVATRIIKERKNK